jgi:hypothetical protein
MNTKDLGDLAELSAAKKLISIGNSVSFHFGDNERYDLILDGKNGLEKVQVRKATRREGYLVFKCYSNHRADGKIKRTSFDEKEIDCFLVWYREEDEIYKIPIQDAPKTEMRLRIDETRNSQEQNVNWASDYKIE